MRIYQIAMTADDLDETEAFYRDVVGARFMARFDPPGLLFFDAGGTRLMFEKSRQPEGDSTGRPASSVLYFWVDDIDAAVTEFEARGATFEAPPHPIHKDDDGTFGAAGETEWMAFFKDPAGNVLALATRRK